MSIVEQVVSVLRAIPEAVWGALITLLTVALTERRNEARTKAQLAHEAQENERSRTMELRREVHLPAVAAMAEVVSFFGAMPSKTAEEINASEPLLRFAVAASRLSAVSEPQTALLANEISTECGLLFLQLAPMALSVTVARSAIETHDELIAQYLKGMSGVTAAMREINESGIQNDVRFAALVRQQEELQRRFDDQFLKRGQAVAQMEVQQREYALTFIKAMRDLLEKNVRVLVSIRTDLGQDSDAAHFLQAMRGQGERVYAAAERALAEAALQQEVA
jgi:hypothetical protein